MSFNSHGLVVGVGGQRHCTVALLGDECSGKRCEAEKTNKKREKKRRMIMRVGNIGCSKSNSYIGNIL